MRNLTIKRTKSFVASLVTLKVYIEDQDFCEITVNGVPCRRLGELKNGEESTFQIGEEAARVYVIADKLSKEYCNEFYQLPAGAEDVYLTGKNKFSPAAGNPFRFDGNDSAEVTANRKKGFNRGLVVLVIAIAVGVLLGFMVSFFLGVGGSAKPKTFTAEEMSITLTTAFKTSDLGKEQGILTCFDSRNVAVFVRKEAFAEIPELEGYTLEEYGNALIVLNKYTGETLKKSDGLTYFEHEYTDPDKGDTFRYITYIYQTPGAFWTAEFGGYKKYIDAHTDDIAEWAKTVTFSR